MWEILYLRYQVVFPLQFYQKVEQFFRNVQYIFIMYLFINFSIPDMLYRNTSQASGSSKT